MRVLPSYLRRRRFSARVRLSMRSLATVGLFFTAVLAGAAGNGPMSLVFLTVTALMGVAVARAYRDTRRIAAAIRLHRTVEKALDKLASRGWHLKHHVRWPEGPDCGHLAMVPSGELAFAVKDCTVSAGDFDLSLTQEFASALSETGRPYVPICVAPSGAPQSSDDRGVICCTPEQLVAELLDAERAFMTGLQDEGTRRELLYSEISAN